MFKTCIICGSRAGSGEHIFPAAFGGRRTNKGIYCGSHNEAFGRYVSAPLSSLDIVNAAIGVVPDRHDEVRPAPADSADGEQFLVSMGSVKIAPPRPLKETPELVGKEVVLTFADQGQAAKWIANQKKAGFDVKVGAFGPVQSRIITKSLRANRVLGSEVSGATTARFTTHIDPLAPHPPNDIAELREEGLSLVMGSPEDGRQYLREIVSGQLNNPFEEIFWAASDNQLKATCEELLPELLATKALPPSRRSEQILMLLSQHQQRIFNLLREGIQGFERSATDVPQVIHDAWKQLIAGEDNTHRGITMTSEAALHIATAVLSDEIRKCLDADSLDVTSLGELIGGREGLGIVLRIVTCLVFNGIKQ